MAIEYHLATTLDPAAFIDVLKRSGLAERRPVDDHDRIRRMLENADLIVIAQDVATGVLVGVARSITDFAYCCYLSDLAVDRAYQGRGVGRRLIEETRRAAGPQSMCLLLSAPASTSFYETIGIPRADNAFLFPRDG